MELYPLQYRYRRVVRAKLYIDEHFASPLDLDQIADEACFSKFHFIGLFRKAYGQTPHQYLTRVRISHARELLAASVPVAKVCFDVGFESVSSFTGLFKRHVGLTPAAYQRKQLSLAENIRERPLEYIPNCFAEINGWLETQFSRIEKS